MLWILEKSAGFRTVSTCCIKKVINKLQMISLYRFRCNRKTSIGIELGDQTQQLSIVLHYNTECN